MTLTFNRGNVLSLLRKARTTEATSISRANAKKRTEHAKYVKEEIKKLEGALAAAKRGEEFKRISEYSIKPELELSDRSKHLDTLDSTIQLIELATDATIAVPVDRTDKFGLIELLRRLKP